MLYLCLPQNKTQRSHINITILFSEIEKVGGTCDLTHRRAFMRTNGIKSKIVGNETENLNCTTVVTRMTRTDPGPPESQLGQLCQTNLNRGGII